MVTVFDVEPGSYAAKSGIKKGDIITKINSHEIVDVLDFRFYSMDTTLNIELNNGKTIKLKKPEYAETGLLFSTYLMDKQHSCKNKCIFCFIDQLPKGLRESLYFKDDDSRLSFLFGNYITLTNITEHEVDRIIKMHISPINISVHTVNPQLRCKIMNNRFAGESLKYLYKFNDAGIKINCQLVLMPGINDGAELERSLNELLSLENVQCIAAVPVGLTKYREGLYPLMPFTKGEARSVVELIEEKSGDSKRAFAADEFYLKAGLPIKEPDFYGDFLQLENGVGMYSLFKSEAYDAIETGNFSPTLEKTVITGKLAEELIINIVDKARSKWHNLKCKVIAIENEFFGKNITVSGLITGTDIINQTSNKHLGDLVLLPSSMLSALNDVFLDDVSVEQLEKKLNIKTEFINLDGYAFIEALLR